MRPVFRNPFFLVLIVLGLSCSFSSCSNIKKLTYLQGSFDTAKLSHVNATEPIIRKGDILSIVVFSDNPEATKIYNQAVSVGSGGGAAAAPPGYQVDERGDILFQGVGIIHIEGLTKAQLKDSLDIRLTQLLTNPYYSIRFLNYKFTMVGEVAHPGVINIPGESINMLEALAMAGDMTIYGRRDNILVMRNNNGKREWARLDIKDPNIVLSPYYYLQQNDIVYVEAVKKKLTEPNLLRNTTILLSAISAFAIFYNLFHQ
jgi:polysaccharide export outer membrane protein